MMQLYLLDSPVDRFEGEVVAVLYFANDRPLHGPAALLDWRLNGRLTGELLRGNLDGSPGEHLLVKSNGKIAAEWALFVGGGKHPDQMESEHRQLLRHLLATCIRAGATRIGLGLSLPAGMNSLQLQRLVREVLNDLDPGGHDCLLGIVDGSSRLV